MTTKKLQDFGLYFITDSILTKKNAIDDARAAVKAGVKMVQYREKYAPAEQMLKEALKIRKICKNKVLFIVNDRIDVAIASDADGVHLGQDDIPYEYARKILGRNKIIGLSAHSAKDAILNEKIGADYTSIGPIYRTSTKKDSKSPIGLGPIRQLKKLKIPFVAIGGINESNLQHILDVGAKNVAMISAIVAKDDVQQSVKTFIKIINSNKQ